MTRWETMVTHQERPARILPFPQEQHFGTALQPGVVFPGSTLDAYHLLAERGEMTSAAMAVELELSCEQLQAIVAELASLRLLRETEDGTLIAIPHSQAVDELLAEQALLLSRALEHLSEGGRRLRTVVENRSMLDPSEASRISSTMLGGAAGRGMFDLSREASDTIAALHPGGAFSDELLERSLARAVENLRRGVRMRVVHQTSALGRPSVVSYLSQLAGLGCRVRLRDNLPFRMLLLDGSVAICSVPASGAYSLRGQRVMALLVRIFETTWVDAVPLETVLSKGRNLPVTPAAIEQSDGRVVTLAATHEAILRLLAEGQTDQSIAHALGITTRTVTRRISEIYDLLGVESRFQAGIAAKERGIV
jgi:DNA-binding CsgD family transcriptional regulator